VSCSGWGARPEARRLVGSDSHTRREISFAPVDVSASWFFLIKPGLNMQDGWNLGQFRARPL